MYFYTSPISHLQHLKLSSTVIMLGEDLLSPKCRVGKKSEKKQWLLISSGHLRAVFWQVFLLTWVLAMEKDARENSFWEANRMWCGPLQKSWEV